MLSLTLLFPLLTQRFGYLDKGLLLSGYLGIVLIGFFASGIRDADVLNVQESTRCSIDEFRHPHNAVDDRFALSPWGTDNPIPELPVAP